MEKKQISILISDSIGHVSAILTSPKGPAAILVLAHGAGAGMNHIFMESLAAELSQHSIATLRFNFPYMENKKGRPDPAPIAEKTVAMLIETAHNLFPVLPLFAGGKSFGGRMTSQRLSKECPEYVKGIVFYGFPLHQIGNPSIERAAHLQKIQIPILFLQGSKDKMAELSLLKGVCKDLPTSTLNVLEGADHSFKAGKQNLMGVLGESTVVWVKTLSI